ncbi:MAG: DUF3791 domain-containing protein [Bacteroidales bacterium]|nr:DUF3791 domain-containing protein [Bacteroidales bacterium]
MYLIYKEIIMLPLSKEEILMTFVASCVETVAEKLNIPSKEILNRMINVNLIDGYILPCYEVLHSESRENITQDIINCLLNWENLKK